MPYQTLSFEKMVGMPSQEVRTFICGLHTTSCYMFFILFQVIYKKSQIPCPLPVLDNSVGNWSSNSTTVPLHIVMLPNNSANSELNFMMDSTYKQYSSSFEETKDKLHQSGVEYEAHGEDNDKCQPKYFVFNSRVQLCYHLFDRKLCVCCLPFSLD